MKHLLKLYILLFASIISAQNFDFAETDTIPTETSTTYQKTVDEDIKSFEEEAKENSIPSKTLKNIIDANNGFYIISGVFQKNKNLQSQVRKFNKKGFNSGYMYNPESEIYYFFINQYGSWQEAIEQSKTKFDGKYKKDIWILEVANGDFNQNDIEIEKNSNTLTSVKKPLVKDSENTNKLIKQADNYFSKMWYAEAAKYYELALEKYGNNYPSEVLQKAGDAHYFNTNMESAYKWYNLLYEKDGDDMSTDNLFKYAHSLKGMDNYKRSKKLMKLYNKKVSKGLTSQNTENNDVVLDALRKMKDRFEVKNLQVNSNYADFAPTYFNEDQVVFASSKDSSFLNTRRYKWNNQPYLDLFVAKLNTESQELQNAVKFSKKINTKYHDASATFSPDNKTMYFTRNNYGKKLKRAKNGINNLKIYRSKKVDGEWTEATEVPFNSDEYSTGHPTLSKDGKQLYFVSDMPGTIGQTDIFVADVLEDGSLSTPRNLGPEINTEQKEMFPFISDQKLYFSSNGHVGLGGLDVFEVSFNDEEEAFLEVRNVGKPVNSKKDDFAYIVNEETQKGYFSSNRPGGKGDDDIYAFERLEPIEIPTAKNAIAGVVTELIEGDIMPMAMVELLDENNIKLKEMETDENGSFVFEDLDANKRYILKTTKEDYFEDEREASTLQNEIVNVEVAMRKLNKMIKVENGIRKLKTEMIYFNFDKSFIRKDAALELDKLVEVMKETPSMVIKIESHTDSRGDAVYNKYLSDKRAKSSRDYIISQGIAPERITSAIGYGEEQLLNNCDGSRPCTEEEHYLNRRSEFIIVDM